jgi:hypothetical protein
MMASDAAPGRFQELLSQLRKEHELQVEELRAEIRRLLSRDQPNGPKLTFDGGRVEREKLSSYSENEEEFSRSISVRRALSNISSYEDAHTFHLKESWTKIPVASGLWGLDLDKEVAREYIESVDSRRGGSLLEDISAICTNKAVQRLSMIGSRIGLAMICSRIASKLQSPDGFVMHPSNHVRVSWDICGLMLIAYDMFCIPLMIAFEPSDNYFFAAMSWITLLFWTFDMFLSLQTGYYENGRLVMSRKRIIRNYVLGWFWIDCVVVVPDWFLTFWGNAGSHSQVGHLARTLKVTRSLRLLRMLKLKRIFLWIYDMIDSEYSFIVFGLCRLLLVILVLNHFVACAWYGLGQYSMDQGYAMNWLEDVGLTPVYGESLGWKYFTSLHWSITQFTPASMDIYATNIIERMFSIVVLFWALVALSSIIANITASMTAIRNMGNDEMKQTWLLRRYLKLRDVPFQLQERILKYAEWHQTTTRDQVKEDTVQLLKTISPQLRVEIAAETGLPIVTGHPFFKYMVDDDNLRSIAHRICESAVTYVTYAAGDHCFEVENEAVASYFVRSGTYDYTVDGDLSIESLGRPKWFAEGVLWTDWRHYGTLKARSPGELCCVSPACFATVLRLHPRTWHYGKVYGTKFVEFINKVSPSKLSDYMPNCERWASVPSCDENRLTRLSQSSSRQLTGTEALALILREATDEGTREGTLPGSSTQLRLGGAAAEKPIQVAWE